MTVLKAQRSELAGCMGFATQHPTAEWTATELIQAFPWDAAPRYLLGGRDHGIHQKPEKSSHTTRASAGWTEFRSDGLLGDK